MDKDNFFIKSQIKSNIDQLERLLDTGVFGAPALREFWEPVFISIILKLNDSLQKFKILDKRISFNDDIPSGDITDLINKVRNAICHLDSRENMLDQESQIKFVFNIIVGKGIMMRIGEREIGSSYEDDIAFFFGEYCIYFKRHILRLLKESKSKYKEIYPTG
ncbi:hypothetical protein KW786_02595 [Candidatus Parcubacteria bacterium]|nr:hypothetical protein [Candidatus Parcubacteria bacterium]